jgi:beta-glucosidase
MIKTFLNWPAIFADNFTEGVNIDYKHFIAHNITPQYEFGFGLSYTTFEYTDLSIKRTKANHDVEAPRSPSEEEGTIPEGGISSLWDIMLNVSHNVTNTGHVDSAEVSQLYIGIPGGPIKQLRGFEKKFLKPGETKEFSFAVTRRDLSTWTSDLGWILQRGCYKVYVGKSVLDVQLAGSFAIWHSPSLCIRC